MVSSDKAVIVDGIKKSFGEVAALRGVSFEVARGEVLGLLGPNGAGKTTTVNILATLITPDSGRALIAGHDVVSDPAGVRRSLMLTGQHVALDDLLTGRENLLMFGRLQGLKKKVAKAAGPGAARAVRPGRCRRPRGRQLLRRHEAPHRHRVRAGGPARGGVPRRADHRAGSAQQAGDLGAGHRLQGGGHRDAADDAVPRGSRPAQRPHHRDRQGHRHRRRHRRPAQGAHRRHLLRDRARPAARHPRHGQGRWDRCCPTRTGQRCPRPRTGSRCPRPTARTP